MRNVLRFRVHLRRALLGPATLSSRWGRANALFACAVLIGATTGYFLFDAVPPGLAGQTGSVHAAAVPAEAIAGQASVIDGDTIEIHETRIRLHGIDATESDQLCVVRDEQVRCGHQAAFALFVRIDRGTVSSEPKAQERHGRRVYI